MIADMREELQMGNRSILSGKLREEIEKRLEKKEQVVLFLNRRGYAGFVSCRACGHVMKCPHCDVSLTAHNNGKLVCHYCGYEEPMIKVCPSCGSRHVGGFKAGTQQIEDLVKREFPEARACEWIWIRRRIKTVMKEYYLHLRMAKQIFWLVRR